jgi:hypothetical protein
MKIKIVLLAFLIYLIASAAFANLPDLHIDPIEVQNSLFISNEYISPDSCAVQEGCIEKAGNRRLMRFSVALENIGNSDFYLGPPEINPLAYFSPCHHHYHLNGVMKYELLGPYTSQVRASGNIPLAGRKQGFCMRDNYPIDPANQSTPQYDCENQGITQGWVDLYSSELDCQWLDITGLEAGVYILRLIVNPEKLFSESNFSNNQTEVPVFISETEVNT